MITWECRYLPLPFWPPQRHTGRLRAGQGVISRYPLVQNTRQRLSQPLTQPLSSRFFPLSHRANRGSAVRLGRTVRLLNVHLEPHDVATRQRQAQELVAFVRQGGQTRQTACSWVPFTASPLRRQLCTGTPLSSWIKPWISIATGLRDRLRLVANMSPGYPAAAPRYRLDHVLVGPGLQGVEAQVIMLHEPVSDHLPLLVRLRWALPRGHTEPE